MAVQQRKSANKKKNSDIKEQKEDSKKKISNLKNKADESFSSKIPWKKILYRFLLSLFMVFAVYWTSHKEDNYHVFARQKDKLKLTSAEVPCSASYKKEISTFKECIPNHCGRLVTDMVVTPEEAAHLLRVSQKGMAFGRSSGGASVLDLHSGALSHGDSFINIYEKLKASGKNNVFTQDDFKVYSNVRTKIQQVISYNFGLPFNKLFLTHPTFFSEMTSRPPKTPHDEYWHPHVDKETYPSFHYTSLLYLSDYGADFTGGRFIFVSDNMTVEPRMGRVSAFTSGAENPHRVERVDSGTRHALTVSFSCDPDKAVQDPHL